MVCEALLLLCFLGGAHPVQAAREDIYSRTQADNFHKVTSGGQNPNGIRSLSSNETDPERYVCKKSWYKDLQDYYKPKDLETSIRVFVSLIQNPGIGGEIVFDLKSKEYVWTIKKQNLQSDAQQYLAVEDHMSHLKNIVEAWLKSFDENKRKGGTPKPFDLRQQQVDEEEEVDEIADDIGDENEAFLTGPPNQREEEMSIPQVQWQLVNGKHGDQKLVSMRIRSKSFFLAIKVFWCMMGGKSWSNKLFKVADYTNDASWLQVWWDKGLDHSGKNLTPKDLKFLLECHSKMLDRRWAQHEKDQEAKRIDDYLEKEQLREDRAHIFVSQLITMDRHGIKNIFGI